MNRRSFLKTLAAAVAGATLDPERLLWIPGQKTIFLPTPGGQPLTYAMLAQMMHRISERGFGDLNVIYSSSTIVDEYRRLLKRDADPRNKGVLRDLAVLDTRAALLPSGAKVDGLYRDLQRRTRAVVMEHPKWRGRILAGVEPVHPIKFTDSGIIHYADKRGDTVDPSQVDPLAHFA